MWRCSLYHWWKCLWSTLLYVIYVYILIPLDDFYLRGKHSFWFEEKKGNIFMKIVFSFKRDVYVFLIANSCHFLVQHCHLHVAFQKLKGQTLGSSFLFFCLAWTGQILRKISQETITYLCFSGHYIHWSQMSRWGHQLL